MATVLPSSTLGALVYVMLIGAEPYYHFLIDVLEILSIPLNQARSSVLAKSRLSSEIQSDRNTTQLEEIPQRETCLIEGLLASRKDQSRPMH